MKALLSIALGIIAAIGGFVDIGDLVFNTQAGATFGYQLLWAVAARRRRDRRLRRDVRPRGGGHPAAGVRRRARAARASAPGSSTLVAAELVNLLTLAAEIGGIALVLQLLFDAAVPAC